MLERFSRGIRVAALGVALTSTSVACVSADNNAQIGGNDGVNILNCATGPTKNHTELILPRGLSENVGGVVFRSKGRGTFEIVPEINDGLALIIVDGQKDNEGTFAENEIHLNSDDTITWPYDGINYTIATSVTSDNALQLDINQACADSSSK